AGLCLPPWMAEMPVLQEQKPALRPECKEKCLLTILSGPRSSGSLVYQSQLSIRGQGGDSRHPAFRSAGQPSAVQFCSDKIVHAPTRSFGIIQTMLLALPNFGLERMGRKKVAAMPVWLYWARCARKKPKTKNQKPKTKNQKPKNFPATGRQKTFQVAAVFPGPLGPARR